MRASQTARASGPLTSARQILLVGWALWAVGLGLFSTLDSSSGLGKQIGYCECGEATAREGRLLTPAPAPAALLAGVGVGATLQRESWPPSAPITSS